MYFQHLQNVFSTLAKCIFKIVRRHSLPTLSLPRLGSMSPIKQSHFIFDKKKEEREEGIVEREEEERAGSFFVGLDQQQPGDESSNCSTPTMMEPRARV